MSHKPLLYRAPVERLTLQLQQIPMPLRRQAWHLYAMLRRKACDETLGQEISETTELLLSAVSGGLPFRVVTQAVKLAQSFTEGELGLLGAHHRAARAHARESFFLLRRSFRQALGHRVLPPEAVWSLNDVLSKELWRAVCDGSQKQVVSAIGVLVYDSQQSLMAEVSVAVPARNAVDAELQACIHALQTLLGMGCRHALVEVDSLGVLSGLSQKLPLKYCLLEADLLMLSRRFISLQVRLSPRVTTYPADRMAARLSRH